MGRREDVFKVVRELERCRVETSVRVVGDEQEEMSSLSSAVIIITEIEQKKSVVLFRETGRLLDRVHEKVIHRKPSCMS